MFSYHTAKKLNVLAAPQNVRPSGGLTDINLDKSLIKYKVVYLIQQEHL